MRLSDLDKVMLAGTQGDAKRIAMEGLIQLGDAFGANEMVDIGYAHIHAGMAMYLGDVELMEDLVSKGARTAVPKILFCLGLMLRCSKRHSAVNV